MAVAEIRRVQAVAKIRQNVASQLDHGFLDFGCVLFILLSTVQKKAAAWFVLQFSPNTIRGDQLTFEHHEFGNQFDTRRLCTSVSSATSSTCTCTTCAPAQYHLEDEFDVRCMCREC